MIREEILLLETMWYSAEKHSDDDCFIITDTDHGTRFSVYYGQLEDLYFILSVLLGKEVR